MKKFLTILTIGLLFVHNSHSQFNKIQTDDFDIISTSMQLDYVLGHAIRCSHNALDFHRRLFEYDPKEKIFIIILVNTTNRYYWLICYGSKLF